MADPKLEPPVPPDAERILGWIMVALTVWGVFHGVGAWTLNHDPRRALMVIACMAAFIGFWGVMLRLRRKRLERASGPDSPART